MIGKVTTLAHELRNYAMEAASLVTISLFPSTEGTKVFGRFGNDIGTKLKSDSANIFTTDFHVKIDFGICHQSRSGTGECADTGLWGKCMSSRK
mmetsp:Transcript_77720/g.224704  ORF Transcript_77720/g.224704 Transcript_77720/m.224704 type:complete len:94 (+) Transcript_77720:174-455(+)